MISYPYLFMEQVKQDRLINYPTAQAEMAKAMGWLDPNKADFASVDRKTVALEIIAVQLARIADYLERREDR